MLLTSELVARIDRTVVDAGPSPGFDPMTEADYLALAERLLSERPCGQPLFVFAYGSLLWKPAFEPSEERTAIAHGWHRTFRLRLTRWRGTADHPGLMLILDRGGSCRGIVQRIPDADAHRAILALLRREVSSRVTTNRPRWICVTIDGVRQKAIAFCADRQGPAYAGRQSETAMADILATAVGHLGSCADYLLRTVDNLHKRGIRDRKLWKLQAMVATRILESTSRPDREIRR
jgi:glutathione-specific gamma-glutamylcyclotransferase